jgi:hypothetical protein
VRFFVSFLFCAAALFGVHVPAANAAQVVVTFPQPKKPITNQDVVRMARAKFSDSTIIKAIHADDPRFDLSATALVALKTAGVSEAVIAEMLSAGSDPAAAPAAAPRPQPPAALTPAIPVPTTLAGSAPAALPEGIDDIGVYYKKDGKWVQMLRGRQLEDRRSFEVHRNCRHR